MSKMKILLDRAAIEMSAYRFTAGREQTGALAQMRGSGVKPP
jgi:hypothetical protein